MEKKYFKEYLIENRKILLIKGDITTIAVDAIVNAANNTLRGGGGVDGAIHSKGGSEILNECINKYPDGCPTGDCRITSAGDLPSKFVIHCVGPIYQNKNNLKNAELLENCYKSALKIANEKKLVSIAFPSISTGIYGYPIQEASEIAIKTILDYIEKDEISIKQVFIVTFSANDYGVYYSKFEKIRNEN